MQNAIKNDIDAKFKEVAGKLKKALPRGSTSKIKARLEEKGITVSGAMINYVLAGDKPDHNGILIEAKAYLEEWTRKQKELKEAELNKLETGLDDLVKEVDQLK